MDLLRSSRSVVGLVRVGFPARAGMDPDLVAGATWYSEAGFPARAGMDPTSDDLRDDYGIASPRAPDDPIRQHATSCKLLAARGWTVSPAVALVLQGGFPARAGMDPTSDDRRDDYGMASPRARGWTAAALLPAAHSDGFPARAGWTCVRSGADRRSEGFPARAGMDLTYQMRDQSGIRVPRARGDGPCRSATVALSSRGWMDRPGGSKSSFRGVGDPSCFLTMEPGPASSGRQLLAPRNSPKWGRRHESVRTGR